MIGMARYSDHIFGYWAVFDHLEGIFHCKFMKLQVLGTIEIIEIIKMTIYPEY